MKSSVATCLLAIAASASAFEFAWGFGGSALQIEGGWNADGKGESTFDRWYHTTRPDQPNADVAADHYNRWREDLGYMGQFNASAYRFSIAWSRVLPNCTGTVNEAGIKFYSDLIDELIRLNIEPFLTMFHFDLPQACWEQHRGFLTKGFVDVFAQYARLLYQRFGDRVRYWLTLNEPEANCNFCYATGIFAPGAAGGDADKWRCMYHSHLIHGTVVQIARREFNATARGWKFGMPSIFPYFAPASEECEYADWMERGWTWGPGADPSLPQFTPAEQELIRGTMDFSAVNYYSASGVGSSLPFVMPSGIDWQTVYPAGVRGLVKYFYDKYKLDVYVTEIGYPVPDEARFPTAAQVVDDPLRRTFWEYTVTNLTAAIVEDRVPVKGMLVWALLDNMEWTNYNPRFGAIAVDYFNNTLTRSVKQSTFWLADYYRGQNLSSPFPLRAPLLPTSTAAATSTTTAVPSTTVARTTAVTSASVSASASPSAPATTSSKSGAAERRVGAGAALAAAAVGLIAAVL
ncbi:hypothetical protein HDU96_006095 [Phlyctochytrium bullatum]|nr:hypothetical protein HDU96_006095 [Phlyctochytrium bullatum]